MPQMPIESTPTWAAYQAKLAELAAARKGSAAESDARVESEKLLRRCEAEAAGFVAPV